MMTSEQNERLTRVGPGTPCGEMLRRYWWPVGFGAHVTSKPVPVRVLGEDLILFRDGSGALGLIERACPHRGAGLELGRVESDGIRCCYHGWKFDRTGTCLDMPAEPDDTPLRREVKARTYRAQDVAGLVFAYMGPAPAPEIPPYDLLVREDMNRVLYSKEEKCNWLQRAENGCDPHHLMALHAPGYPQIALKPANVTWEKTWYGFRQEQQYPDSLYNVTHQIFPSHTRRLAARVGDDPKHYLNLRVPVDDVTTITYFVQAVIAERGPYTITTRDHTAYDYMAYEEVDDGWWRIPSHEQDRIAQESQGRIADRSRETLGTSDRGIVMFRRNLEESIRAVQEGRDPVGVVRDRTRNDVIRFDAGKNFSGGTTRPPAIIAT
jgi:5,5'-dehydrodivanillate O-demethylase